MLPRFCTQQPGSKYTEPAGQVLTQLLTSHTHSNRSMTHSKQQLQFQTWFLHSALPSYGFTNFSVHASTFEINTSPITHSKIIRSRHQPRQLNWIPGFNHSNWKRKSSWLKQWRWWSFFFFFRESRTMKHYFLTNTRLPAIVKPSAQNKHSRVSVDLPCWYFIWVLQPFLGVNHCRTQHLIPHCIRTSF